MYDKIIQFYNTYTLTDLYSFIDQFDIYVFIDNMSGNKLILGAIVSTVILLFTPIKNFVANIIVYLIVIGFIFLVTVLWKNSTMTPTETFVSFTVGLLSIAGFFVYTNLIRH